MKRFAAAALTIATFVFAASCSRQDEDRAKARAREIAEQTKRDARDLGRDAKRTASEISDKTKSAWDAAKIQTDGSTDAAARKLKRGGEQLARAGAEAGSTVRDATTTARVKSKLAAEVGLQPASDIHVASAGEVVTLSGEVNSPDRKQAAEKAAMSVDGVLRVVNHLQVR